MTNAIEIGGLAKAFGKTRALDGIDLVVHTGSVYGLLGPITAIAVPIAFRQYYRER